MCRVTTRGALGAYPATGVSDVRKLGEIMTVSLVIVSHSAEVARGVQAMIEQIAPEARVVAAGGTDGGRIGTSFDLVNDAVVEASTARGVVLIGDFGSAQLVIRTVLTQLGPGIQTTVRAADAPLIEGSIAAAVAAAGGADINEVVWRAEQAWETASAIQSRTASRAGSWQTGRDDSVERRLVLRNKLGLHARPAAILARLASSYTSDVVVNGVDAKSILEIMKLGAVGGDQITVAAQGADADGVLEAISAVVADGFGES